MSGARRVPAASAGATLSGAAASGTGGLPAVWGATDDEVAAPFPCDDLLGVPHEAWFRAVDVGAAGHVLFRWLCQLKVAPYSYDLIDNFGRRSPRSLVPGADDLAVGQQVMTIFRLTDFVAGESLTMVLDGPGALALFGELALSYVVVPRD